MSRSRRTFLGYSSPSMVMVEWSNPNGLIERRLFPEDPDLLREIAKALIRKADNL